MKKHLIVLATVVALAVGLSSCSMVGGVISAGNEIAGAIYTGYTKPYEITPNKVGTKVGTAKNVGVLGIVAVGNAGVNDAAKLAGITKISHVDVKTLSVLGLFVVKTYYVYGE